MWFLNIFTFVNIYSKELILYLILILLLNYNKDQFFYIFRFELYNNNDKLKASISFILQISLCILYFTDTCILHSDCSELDL